MENSAILIKTTVDKIIDELKGRGGFDGWWGCIDDETQDEIKEELEQIIITHCYISCSKNSDK